MESPSLGPRAPVLVTGLPEPKAKKRLSWRESMTNIICREWFPRKPSTETEQAETSLGITGEPRYFYAMRTEHAFGFAVFFFREVFNFAWPQNTKGATPFDSGGLWHGRIATQPPASSTQRIRIFQRCQTSLPSWAQVFRRHVSTNYSSVEEYIRGDPPSTGTAPIIVGSPNKSRAWTWEVRVPGELMNEGVDLYRGFLSKEDQNKYRDWLWTDSELDDSTCRSIESWMQENMTVAPLGISTSKMAESALLEDELE